MPVACPLSLSRRAPQASVIQHALRLTQLSSLPRSVHNHAHAHAHAHAHGANQARPRGHKAPSLKSALASAAEKNVAPALCTDSAEISFVSTRYLEWRAFITAEKHHHHDGGLRHASENNMPSSTATQALQKMLARRVAVMADSSSTHKVELSWHEGRTLSSMGATEEDLDTWLDILTTRDTLRAALLLTSGLQPPPFVYLYMLRRQHIRPDALRLLVHHLPRWYRSAFAHSQHKSLASDNADSALQASVFRVFVRLLRHCRRVWPQAIEALSLHLTRYLCLSRNARCDTEQGNVPADHIARLTRMYNRALYLVAEPTKLSPFKNTVYQEAAQQTLLRFMAEHNPPLVINREGYRGVMRIQLASKKTSSEREWARLKSPSWPPWKDDRTGMDAHIGLEHGVSRARHVLNRMQEAGYSLQPWDRIALIYAGWDTDFSPTIQTRTILRYNTNPFLAAQLWVARIRTTRTAQQAWACFLAYQDEKLAPSPSVYHAMFSVLAQERKRLRLGSDNIGHEIDDHSGEPLYPGDTRELGSPPSSSHQLTYTRTEMPSVRELFNRMQQDGLSPSGSTLALLVDSAESLEEGMMYLKSGVQKHRDAIETLSSETVDHGHLATLPDSVFAAYVGLLCRFPHTSLDPLVPNRYYYQNLHIRLNQPLSRAIYLLVEQGRQHQPSWNNVFRALARRIAPAVSSNWRQLHVQQIGLSPEQEMFDKIFAYKLACQNIDSMQKEDLTLDVEAFRHFSIIVEHAAVASNSIIQEYGDAPGKAKSAVDTRLITRAKEMLLEAPYIREQFWALVRGRNESDAESTDDAAEQIALPSLINIPGPAIIHAYVRALGLLRDYQGLEELTRWMIQFQEELTECRAIDRNGAVVMRRVLTALRVFVEGLWETSKPMSSEGGDLLEESGASPDQAEEIAALVDSVEDWGGWPSDDETAEYLERMFQ